MEKNNGAGLLLAFLAGAAIGAAVGYFMSSDKKDKIIDEIKEGAGDLKETIIDHINKMKEKSSAETEDQSQPV